MGSHKSDPRNYAQRFLDPWNDHDAESAVTWFTDDSSWEFTVGSEPAGTRYDGQDAIKRKFNSIVEEIPDLHYELVECYAGEDHLIMEILVTGKNAKTGRELRYQACDILVFRGAKVATKRSYRKVVS